MADLVNAETHIRDGRIVAIVRVPELTPQDAVAMTDALVEGGVRALEFTLTTRGALSAVAAAADAAGDRAAVGAGTVLAEDDVRAVADAGAQFVVSPNVSPAVIGRAADLGLLALPGAYTPTEVVTAVDSGARLVKIFPALPAGLSYLRAVRAPLPDVGLVPTGGIGLADIRDFLGAGAVAVGLGSSLVRSIDDLDDLRIRAERAAAEAALPRLAD